MPSHQWIRITDAANIPARQGRAVTVSGRELAIFNLGDRFVAIENSCPHRGGPLCDGIVTGTSVVCPLHGWKVDLDSGAVERPSIAECVATVPARVEDGIILLDVSALAAQQHETAA